jgi:protein TonB
LNALSESERAAFRSKRGLASSRDRLRESLGHRATSVIIAVVLEALLLLALLTLGRTEPPAAKPEATVIQLIDAQPDSAPEPSPRTKPEARQPDTAPPQRSTPKAIQQPAIKPAIVIPSLIPLSHDEMAAADISKLPSTPAPSPRKSSGKMGPPNSATPGDSERVEGSGPHGEPLYAAAWYREPYDSELRGYLSTAQGPGWGLIACKTVPDFRVEDCIGLGEYPEGSNIERAVLAAAWQFRVRPPRLGGRPQVGEWVRIRIDYGLKRS